MKYIICDLDGTLFDISHRLPLLHNCRSEEDYDKFHAEHVNDKINEKIADIITDIRYHREVFDGSFTMIYITGRHEKFRKSTEEQLKYNEMRFIGLYETKEDFCNNDDQLFMKPSYEIYTTDFVKDTLDKIFEKYGKENCLFVLDDRPATVKIYRDAGLLCLQVQNSTGFLEDVRR